MFDFSQINEVQLGSGPHSSPQEGLCFMEMVAWFNGEPHSDMPDCTCPVIAAYCRTLNDEMPDEERNAILKPLLPLVVGTVSAQHEILRAEAAAWSLIRSVVPDVLRCIGLSEHITPLLGARSLSSAYPHARAAAEAAQTADHNQGYLGGRIIYAAASAARHVYFDAEPDDAAVAAAYAADDADAFHAKGDWRIAIDLLHEMLAIGPRGEFAHDPVERHAALVELVA